MKDVTIRTIGWTIFGCVFVIMFYGMFISLNMSNADINTSHNITLNTDDQTRDALEYMTNIKEFEVKKDEMYCENKILNLTLQYQIEIKNMEIDYISSLDFLEQHYKIHCVDKEGYFKKECY